MGRDSHGGLVLVSTSHPYSSTSQGLRFPMRVGEETVPTLSKGH